MSSEPYSTKNLVFMHDEGTSTAIPDPRPQVAVGQTYTVPTGTSTMSTDPHAPPANHYDFMERLKALASIAARTGAPVWGARDEQAQNEQRKRDKKHRRHLKAISKASKRRNR